MMSLSPIDLDDHFDQAFKQHAAGQLDAAEQAYRRLLEIDEEHPATLHYLGVLLHQTGRPEPAVRHMRRASQLEAGVADWHNDLGNVLFAQQRFVEATGAYDEALALREDDAQLWNNRGAALLAQGRDADAIDACQRALELAPELAAAMQQLAALYERAGDRMQSSHYQCMAYVLQPHEGKSRELLGVSYYFLGRMEEAAEMCRQWLQEDPGNPTALHLHAAYAGLQVATAAPAYVTRRFDDYADNFDTNLVSHLQYRGPQVLASLLRATLRPPDGALDVLDAGCGTGLCAAVLAPYARRLDGVDLSANMLRHATARGTYTDVAQAEVVEWMNQHDAQYDLVAACDVLIYCGQLDDFFAAARRALRPSGHLTFTVETADGEREEGYFLHPSGRFRHQDDYVRRRLSEAGFAIVLMQEESLRVEIGKPVRGLVVVATAHINSTSRTNTPGELG